MRKIITVSREFGSGGRELGKRLAEYLNLNYLDSQIAEALSQQTNLDKNYLDSKLENGVARYSVSYARSFSRITQASNSAMLIAKQHKLIKEIAAKSDCLFVGRGADAVLGEFNPFKIFVYADTPSKIARCKSRLSEGETATEKEIERKIKSIDKSRKSAHDLYSAYTWGDKSAYNLCINTTDISIKEIIPAIAEIINAFYKGEK